MMNPSERWGLIGHTGFVGGVLKQVGAFSDLYNSKNSEAMKGQSFDGLVCAGVSAVKWWANKNPDEDWAAIERLIAALDETQVGELILISTIDVYPDPSQALDEAAIIEPEANHAYGRHRLHLESWVQKRFQRVRVVRLPALFGPGLKKNALYDLMHDNAVGQINPAGRFQWYPLDRLWSDLQRVRAEDLSLVNLFTEPLAMRRIIGRYFPTAAVAAETLPAPHYRLRTRHAELFGGADGYILSAEGCLDAIGAFLGSSETRGEG